MDKRDIEAGKHTAVAGYSKYSDEQKGVLERTKIIIDWYTTESMGMKRAEELTKVCGDFGRGMPTSDENEKNEGFNPRFY